MNSSSIFKPHGAFSAAIEGRILIAHTSGYWNIEMHRESANQSRELVKTLDASGPWGTIVITHGTLLTSLEVLEAGKKAVADQPLSSNLIALAWVIAPDTEGYALLMPRYEAMYQGLLETKVFADFGAARAWIEGEIAKKGAR